MRNDTYEATADLPVNSRFEPCEAFADDHSGSPVCGGCGWLAGEH